jgi:hypothetical protein
MSASSQRTARWRFVGVGTGHADRVDVHLPVQLRRLQELDADFAEALYVLDRPPRGLDWRMMIDDTRASLMRLPALREAFLVTFDPSTRARSRSVWS